jgi:DNA-binding Xre family transcriptional regulator
MTRRYRVTDLGEVVAYLSDGTVVMYDDLEKTIRQLPTDHDQTEDDYRREFSFRLSKLLFHRGMTQEELAVKTGISNVSISNYIQRKATPSSYNVHKIANALGCSMDDLRCTD